MDFTPCKSLHNEDLEITRNPFDSKDFDKENCPAFSPSIFVKSVSQESSEKKNKDFRWSIDQIAVLKPAEIEEYPYQEYSVSYVREEDEIAAQNAVNEYFAKAMLPSPWTRNNKDHAFKRVTFSPHPPTYFKEPPDSSKNSMNSSGGSEDEGKKFTDGSCQTTLTIPPNIDLEKLLGSSYFSYQEETLPSVNKELNVSTLRRKLFSQEETSSSKEGENANDDDNLCIEIKGLVSGNGTPKTPRTPRTPNWITSSPFRDTTPSNRLSSSHDSVLQSSFIAEPFLSPSVSPIKDNKDSNEHEASSLELSDDEPFSIAISSVEDSNSKNIDPSQLKKNPLGNIAQQCRTNIPSIEPFDSLTDIKESTRNSPIQIPGVSPIRLDRDEAMDISVVSSTRLYGTVNISELPDISQSVKESTARHLHGMTGLFSPISGSRKVKENQNSTDLGKSVIEKNDIDDPDVSFDDGGPLDITDLSSPEEHRNQHSEFEDESCLSDDVFHSPVVIVSPYPTPKRGILKHRSTRDENENPKIKDFLKGKFRSLEHKLCEVENRLENVENVCEKGKQTLVNDGMSTGSVDVESNEKHHRNNGKSFHEVKTGVIQEDVPRVPFKDIANKQDTYRHSILIQQEKRNIDMDRVVVRADAALSKAKKLESCIDGDFELFLENNVNNQSRAVNDDIESTEVAGIMERSGPNCFMHNSELVDYPGSKINDEVLTLQGNGFNEYRMAGVRDSFNDSMNVRSRTTLDVAEFDNSILPGGRRDSRVPTPVMNLAGLSIYTAAKENKIPYASPRPLESAKRGLPVEPSRGDRRHTWPSVKSQRCSTNYYGRSISPCFPSRHRASRSSCLIKQDTANKIRDDWRIRSSSRNGFLAGFR